jgi:hypothetical protein
MNKKPAYRDSETPTQADSRAKTPSGGRPDERGGRHDAEAEQDWLGYVRSCMANAGIDEPTQDLVARELYDEETGSYKFPLYRAHKGATVTDATERETDPGALIQSVMSAMLELARTMPRVEKARAAVARDEAKKELHKKAFSVPRGEDGKFLAAGEAD